MEKRQAASEMLLEYSSEKKRRMVESKPTLSTQGWKIINLSEKSYHVIQTPSIVTSDVRSEIKLAERSKLSDIFYQISTKSLLRKIRDDLPADQIIYGDGKQLFNGKLNF
jgi:hypothetical protein